MLFPYFYQGNVIIPLLPGYLRYNWISWEESWFTALQFNSASIFLQVPPSSNVCIKYACSIWKACCWPIVQIWWSRLPKIKRFHQIQGIFTYRNYFFITKRKDKTSVPISSESQVIWNPITCWYGPNATVKTKRKGDMEKLVDATDLIGLVLGIGTYFWSL